MVIEKWKYDELGNHATLYVPMRDKPKKFDGDIPWLRIEDLDGKYVSDSKSNQYVSNEIIKKMNLVIFPVNTVLCSCSATIGVCAITATKLITNQTFIGIHPNSEIDSQFLYYYLQSQTANLIKIGSGSTILYISRETFEKFKIPILDLNEQKNIVNTLSEIDTLIDSLESLIQKKKNIKQGAMQELLTGKRRLEGFSGKWKEKEFGSLTTLLTNGFVGKVKDHYVNYDNGVLYVQGYNVEENDFNFHGIKRVSHLFNKNHKKSQLELGDLLTIQTGEIGVSATVTPELVGANCHALIISRLKQDQADPRFYCNYFNSKLGRDKLKEIETGTTMKHLNVGDLTKLIVPYPELKEQNAISEIFQHIDVEIKKLENQLNKYTNLKQAMMQKLLTGEIRLI